MRRHVLRPTYEASPHTARRGIWLAARARAQSLAGLILACALLAFSTGCVKTTITEDDVESKQRQIREATEKFLGGEIPPEEQRG